MVLTKQAILDKTFYGINIYAWVLRQYYPGQTVLSISGEDCSPAKNPFNNHNETLMISIKNGIAVHFDKEDTIPAGDVFSFATLYFKSEGISLLETINKELNLHIGDNHVFYNHLLQNESPKVIAQSIPIVSYFKCPVSNVVPYKDVQLTEIFKLIKQNDFEKQTNHLRSLPDKKEARNYKARHFDYVTFSGTFSKRFDDALKLHSGLITIDFDHISNLDKLKENLISDEYFETQLLFISPSGDGLKWIIPIDLAQGTHRENFQAIANYILSAYKLHVDPSGKDISRACFLPYDNQVYINPKFL